MYQVHAHKHHFAVDTISNKLDVITTDDRICIIHERPYSSRTILPSFFLCWIDFRENSILNNFFSHNLKGKKAKENKSFLSKRTQLFNPLCKTSFRKALNSEAFPVLEKERSIISSLTKPRKFTRLK